MLRPHFRWQMGNASCQRNHMWFKSLESFIYALKLHLSRRLVHLMKSKWIWCIFKLPSCLELCVYHRSVCDLVSVFRSPNLMATMKHYRVFVENQLFAVWAVHAFGLAFDRCRAFLALRCTCVPVLRVAFVCVECLAYLFLNRWPIDQFPMDHHQSVIPNPTIVLYLTFDHYPIRTLTKWRMKMNEWGTN